MGYLDNTSFDGFANDPTGLASGSIDFSNPNFGTNPNAPQGGQPNTSALGKPLQGGNLSAQNSGLMGVDTGFKPKNYGELQGYLLRQATDRSNAQLDLAKQNAQNENNREERKLGMTEELFGWKKEEKQRQDQLRAGMMSAANDGGYEGVIQYLQTADPEKAIEFHKAKLSLDNDIMSNDVLKTTSKFQKDNAMMESYGLLGKIGYGIMKLPPEMRQVAYDQTMPMIKQINPNAPDKVTEAAPMFMLSMAQAMPSNILFKAQGEQQQAQSAVGKLNMDIESALKRGAKPDGTEPQDQSLQALLTERATQGAKFQDALQNQNNQQVKMSKDQMGATEATSKNLASASQDFLDYANSYTDFMGAMKTYQQNPNSPQAQAALSRTYLKSLNGRAGVYNAGQEMAVAGATGYKELQNKLHAMMSGEIVNLTPEDAKNLNEIKQTTMKEKLQAQRALEGNWLNDTAKYGNLIKLDAVRLPSNGFIQYSQELADQKQAQQGQMPAPLQEAMQRAAQAKDANGKPLYSPEEIKARINTYLQTQAQAGAKQGQPQLSPADYKGIKSDGE